MYSLRLVVPVVLVLVMSATGAHAIDQDEALALRRDGALKPLESFLEIVRKRHPDATLLEAELERDDGLLIYELEILTAPGQVGELEFDARSGELLQDEEED
jgi:uncharacterized membrane protein YkoI